ncbi:MAG: 3' terminal RNA ribose 2'-O-methyltransferase Hen1 [Phormidesmis sp.]
MLLTLTTTHQPATDLGYLLHKHPARAQTFPMSFGQAHVVYPEASAERCTAALLLDVDPVTLVRGKVPGRSAGGNHGVFDQYVNDRPFVASSFLSVAIAKLFRTAMIGRCTDRPELANIAIPLTVRIPVLPCRGGETFLQDLFEPLGYAVTATPIALDETFAEWGESDYVEATFTHTIRLSELLNHFYVLIPVLDNEKHYWIGDEEVKKLLDHGGGWLAEHPSRELITRRYLKRRGHLTKMALERLEEDEGRETKVEESKKKWQAIAAKKPKNLNQQRLETVTQTLKDCGARRVVDLGCGEGNLLRVLMQENTFEKLTGVDVSYSALARAKKRLRLDEPSAQSKDNVELMQGSLVYRDDRLLDYDAAAVVEVIEHLEPERLATFARLLFGLTRPETVIVTTPNVEYNVLYPMPPGTLREPDHRFEWTRAEFEQWSGAIAQKYGYTVTFSGIGEDYPELGTPTQMGLFRKGGQQS